MGTKDPRFDSSRPVQVRMDHGGLNYYRTVKDAVEAAKLDERIEKISFNSGHGERIRLITYDGETWIYEPVF